MWLSGKGLVWIWLRGKGLVWIWLTWEGLVCNSPWRELIMRRGRSRRRSKIFKGIRKGGGGFWGSWLRGPYGFIRVPSGQENLSCGALGTQIRVGVQGPKALNVWDLRPFASLSAKII